MRYVLHVGLPKTGSTSIQKFLFANIAALDAQGVAYPCSRMNPHYFNQSWMREALADDPERVAATLADCAGRQTTVISFEYFAYMKPRLLARFAKLMERQGEVEGVRVIMYVRNLADRLLALCAQVSKAKAAMFEDVIRREERWGSLGQTVTKLEEAFGAEAVDIRLLEHAGDLERDFCAAAAISWSDAFVPPVRENVSPDPITAQVLALLRSEYPLWASAYTLMPTGLKMPIMEERYLAELHRRVADTDLSHPKLQRFSAELMALRPRAHDAPPALEAFLDALIDGLEAVKAEHLRRESSLRTV